MAHVRFETDRLRIRDWSSDDAEAAFTIYGDPEVVEYLTGVPEESIETQRLFIERVALANSKYPDGFGFWAVERKEDSLLIGAAMLKPLPRTEDFPLWKEFREGGEVPPTHEIEVGWHLGRAHWGNGYATEAALRLLNHGFDAMGLDVVYAVLYGANKRSAGVARRLGMQREGETDRFYERTLEVYKITADDLHRPA